MTTLNITVPRTIREPRGAAWLAEAAVTLMQGLRALGRHLREAGAPMGDSAALRGVARSYEGSDPRLAAELYAIADRHEALRGL
jgi:hypothetical protein